MSIERGSKVTAMFDFPAVYRAYIACRRNKRASHNTQRYEVRLLDHLVTTSAALQSRRWIPARSVSFVCTRPKAREIHAADFADRVVHHLLVPRLEALYEPLFIHDSYSNRKGKGTHAAVQRLQQFMRQTSRNGNRRAFFLQLDIRNFFNRIDRHRLLGLLLTRLDKTLLQQKIDANEYDEMRWLCSVLLERNPAEGAVRRGSPASFAAVPAYKRLGNAPDGCGLAIGNLTSQFFANVYLNELDQFIKHELKCRYYLRYVDDFVLLHESQAQLMVWRKKLQVFLADDLGLELKELAEPVSVSSGCDFLGYVTRSDYRLVRRRVIHHCEEALEDMQKKILRRQGSGTSLMLKRQHREQLHASLCSYFGHFQHAASFHLEQNMLSRFAWLNEIFERRSIHTNRRVLLPLWQPLQVSSFHSQWQWFHRWFRGVVQLIQLGRVFACAAPDMARLPESVQTMMKSAKHVAGFDGMLVAPLSRLRIARALLRRSGISHLFVAEEGYLPQGTLSAASGIHLVRRGMKRRVLRLLWRPDCPGMQV